MTKERIWEFFWYALFGVIGTVINILIFYLLSQKCGVPYLVANFIAWVFSVAFAFVTNKIWVFKSKSWVFPMWFKECVQFIIARIGTCVFDMGYMFVAISLLDFDETISKIVANVIVVILNYILSKLWIFKRERNNICRE